MDADEEKNRFSVKNVYTIKHVQRLYYRKRQKPVTFYPTPGLSAVQKLKKELPLSCRRELLRILMIAESIRHIHAMPEDR